MRDSLDIAVLPGDGIGREVMDACLELLDVAGKASGGPKLVLTRHPAGALHYKDTGEALPAATLESARRADAILFGAMGWPDIRYPDGTEPIPQLDLRMALDLYAGVRPIRWFPGLPRILSDERARGIDFVLVREQTEGLFYARGRAKVVEDREVYDTMQITRAGTSRVSEFSFKLAESRRARRGSARVTCVDKSNVFASMAFFRKVFDDVAAKHPAIGADYAYVDAMALTMVKKPWTLDVMVTENMFGDILSDQMAGLIGGLGLAPSANIGTKASIFEAVHGTAPDIAGQGKANPSALLLSAAMMLEHLGEMDAGARVREAIFAAIRDGIRTGDLGGTASTMEFAKEVARRVK